MGTQGGGIPGAEVARVFAEAGLTVEEGSHDLVVIGTHAGGGYARAYKQTRFWSLQNAQHSRAASRARVARSLEEIRAFAEREVAEPAVPALARAG